MRHRTATAAVWCLVVAACAAGGQRAVVLTTTTTTSAGTASASAADTAPSTTVAVSITPGDAQAPGTTVVDLSADSVAYGPPADNRIVVTTGAGAVIVVDPDGSNRIVLSDVNDRVPPFPVWAPSGERIAWTETSLDSQGQEQFSIVTVNIDGSNPTRMQTPFASYYTAWDASSTALGVLGDDSGGPFGTALAIGLADRDSVANLLDGGTPTYYFAWDPNTSGVLAHTGDGVRYVAPGASALDLGFGAGLYQPPLLTGEPGVVVFGQGADSLGVVRVSSLITGDVADVAFYKGASWMMLHPDGSKVAIQTTGQLGDVSADHLIPGDDAVVLEPGLDLLDLATGEAERVTDEPVLSFFWSPDGEQLLLAGFDDEAGSTSLRWQIYAEHELRSIGESFIPSTMFGGRILPFFDQYGLSSALWSPDSSQFTYSGRNDAGEEGVWVHDVATNTSTLIFEGATLSFWSPT